MLLAVLPQGHRLGTWWGSGSRLYIIQTLARSTGGLTGTQTLPPVLDAITASHHLDAATMLRLILSEVFPNGRAGVPGNAADLTSLQREILSFMASGRVRYTEPAGSATLMLNTRLPLIELSLPADITPLRKWLAGDRPARHRPRGISPFRRR